MPMVIKCKQESCKSSLQNYLNHEIIQKTSPNYGVVFFKFFFCKKKYCLKLFKLEIIVYSVYSLTRFSIFQYHLKKKLGRSTFETLYILTRYIANWQNDRQNANRRWNDRHMYFVLDVWRPPNFGRTSYANWLAHYRPIIWDMANSKGQSRLCNTY